MRSQSRRPVCGGRQADVQLKRKGSAPQKVDGRASGGFSDATQFQNCRTPKWATNLLPGQATTALLLECKLSPRALMTLMIVENSGFPSPDKAR